MAELIADVLLIIWDTAQFLRSLFGKKENRRKPSVWVIGCLAVLVAMLLIPFVVAVMVAEWLLS